MKLVRRSELPAYSKADLPVSKSLANRVLVAAAVAGKPITNEAFITAAEDTNYLLTALSDNDNHRIYIGDGAAPLRFILAYRAAINKPCRISGSPGLMKRPLEPLLDVLHSCGARFLSEADDIVLYQGMTHFGHVSVDTSHSSQYASALMLIAPLFHGTKEITFTGDPVSGPYLTMTAGIMGKLGVHAEVTAAGVRIAPGQYVIPDNLILEKDWSAAAFFYALAACAPDLTIMLTGLTPSSLQGDSVVSDWFEQLGVQSEQTAEGMVIRQHHAPVQSLRLDFTDYPDTAPAVMAACALLKIHGQFTGLEHLRVKESDRLKAMADNLQRFGVTLSEEHGVWTLNPDGLHFPSEVEINTYHDHRMAMAMSLFGLHTTVSIDDPACVGKSFPAFWKIWSNWFDLSD